MRERGRGEGERERERERHGDGIEREKDKAKVEREVANIQSDLCTSINFSISCQFIPSPAAVMSR